MLVVTCRFPLGVYHALAGESFGKPEWPPHPVRLVAALLAASHGPDIADPVPRRAVLTTLSEAAPPTIVAAELVDIDDDSPTGLAAIRGASRWAPRNHEKSELQALSARDIGRGRAEVHKGGVAVGSTTVAFAWPDLCLTDDALATLREAASDVTYLGTSRSPVQLSVATRADPLVHQAAWEVSDELVAGGALVRVPTPGLIAQFDDRHEGRRSTKDKLERAGHLPSVAVGGVRAYAPGRVKRLHEATQVFEPRHWGEVFVLAIDTESADTETMPTASGAYVVARAFRQALLGAYSARGILGEAPSVLHGRGSEPHAAIVPLPSAGFRVRGVPRGDGVIRGIAVVLPHESRLASVHEQRHAVVSGLAAFVRDEDRRWVDLPGAGRIALKEISARPLTTLQPGRYTKPSREWESIVPVVHARRRTSTGPNGVRRQIAADLAHVGLPQNGTFIASGTSSRAGAARRIARPDGMPEKWRALLEGPHGHVRITFEQPVRGPILLGRARHLGTGLFVPVDPHERSAQGGEKA